MQILGPCVDYQYCITHINGLCRFLGSDLPQHNDVLEETCVSSHQLLQIWFQEERKQSHFQQIIRVIIPRFHDRYITLLYILGCLHLNKYFIPFMMEENHSSKPPFLKEKSQEKGVSKNC